jgi:hypothetical protein
MYCKKKKLDKIGVMLIIANSNKKNTKEFQKKRKEILFL